MKLPKIPNPCRKCDKHSAECRLTCGKWKVYQSLKARRKERVIEYNATSDWQGTQYHKEKISRMRNGDYYARDGRLERNKRR